MEYTEMVRVTLEYIEKNIEKKITLDDLADNTFISKYHFHRIFNEAVGVSIMEYIRNRRLTCAANRLINTIDEITDIAMQYQFDSLDGFSKAFKRYYGTSPGRYRKNNKLFNT
jgi:AraC-like DNA-binding protein